MRTFRLTALALALILPSGVVYAAKGKGKAKAAAAEADNPAKPEEINKLKGDFKWGMTPEQVMEIVTKTVEAKYTDRMKKAGADPAKQDRIRGELRKELNEVKKSFTKFEGNKTGWDVSVIDQEFAQNSAEAMLQTREDQWTRYFFFFDNQLYKMYLALEKDYLNKVLAGKGFKEFGEMMQAKYGNARLVMRTENKKQVPDYYLWASMTSDSLKLVDRSGFYGVYCLVVFDTNTQDRVIERRKLTAVTAEKDSLVESVTAKGDNNRDSNDNIIDRITGREVTKPGEEERQPDIVVPRVNAPTAKEVNESGRSSSTKDSGKKKDKDKKPEGLGGLEL